MRVLLFVILHVCVYGVSAQTCGAGSLDLSSEFSTETLTFNGTDSEFQFFVTPCAASAVPCRDGEPGSALYAFLEGACFSVMARYSDGVWSILGDNNDTSDGVAVQYKNGDPCVVLNRAPIIDIEFVCGGETAAVTSNECDYQITVPSQTVCDAAQPTVEEPGSTGLSGGWIFVIILLVPFTVYMIGGTIYNIQRKGEKGTEAIPNVTFWRSLPGYVSEGCRITWAKITCKTTMEDTYEASFVNGDK